MQTDGVGLREGRLANRGLWDWVANQAPWARDALRRHALALNFELDETSKAEVTKRVRHAAGLENEACESESITIDHLPNVDISSPQGLLVSIGSLKNIARLAPNQRLNFAQSGITLVYGDNGTGKSGYCRITKKLCRSLTTDELIGNVFAKDSQAPAEVEVSFKRVGEEHITTEIWRDGTAPPAAISNISVFDTRNARLYVDSENKVGFLPREIALLEQFARQCGEMDKLFDGQLKQQLASVRTPLPGGYTVDGVVAKLLQRLQPKGTLPPEEEIRAQATWTDTLQDEFDALQRKVARDPRALSERYNRLASILSSFGAAISQIEEQLSADKFTALQTARLRHKESLQTASLASTALFKTTEYAGVGSDPWKRMYHHATEYIRSIIPEAKNLPANEGDACALCQQPLSAVGSARMVEFQSFIQGKTSRDVDNANNAFQESLRQYESLKIPTKRELEVALAEYRELDEESESIASSVIDYVVGAEVQRSQIVESARQGTLLEFPAATAQVSTKIVATVKALKDAAMDLATESSGGDEKRTIDRKRLEELRDTQKLSQDLSTVLARRLDLVNCEKYSKCRELVGTKSVSVQITALRRELVTADLEKRVAAEIEALDLTHLPFRLSDRSSGGQSYFSVGLSTPLSVANDRVLSEGEQRALALACFLGELGGDAARNGLIIDDPVSSLDHHRIRRVANRLVAEAEKGRQIIVFTHNILFYNEVIEAAAHADPQVVVERRIITKSVAEGFGLISDKDEPWIAQKVNDRISRLRERLKTIEKFSDFDGEDYRSRVKDFYSDLRETWERLVEEVLLGKVIERFNTDVRTQSLKYVIVDDNDYKKIFWAMKRASERSGHDMAAGRNLPIPKPSDLKSDLIIIDEYRAQIAKRRVETESRRKELETAPGA